MEDVLLKLHSFFYHQEFYPSNLSRFSAVEVRLRVLQCFKDGDPLLLSHLAQADMLDSIFMTLHDEKLEMQEHAVALLGKLGSLNPAYVLPSLRNVLLETLTQLTNSGVPRFVYRIHCFLYLF